LYLYGTSISKISESMFEVDSLNIKNCPLLYVPVKAQGEYVKSSLLGKRIINISRKLQCKNFLMNNTSICEDVIEKMIVPYLLV